MLVAGANAFENFYGSMTEAQSGFSICFVSMATTCLIGFGLLTILIFISIQAKNAAT